MEIIQRTELKNWRKKRERQWEEIIQQSGRVRNQKFMLIEEFKQQAELIHRVFMGDITEVDPLTIGQRPIDHAYFSPHQSIANVREWMLLELESYDRRDKEQLAHFAELLGLYVYVRCSNGIYFEGLTYARETFYGLLGENYDGTGKFFFGGLKMPLPIARETMAEQCEYALEVVSALVDPEYIWLDFYEVTKTYLREKVRDELFLPPSTTKKREELDRKMRWSTCFELLVRPCEESFKSIKKWPETSEWLKSVRFEEAMQDKRIVQWRERIIADIENGELPATMQELWHWAQAERSRDLNLRWSTDETQKGGADPYVDPWAEPEPKPKAKRQPKPAPVLPEPGVEVVWDGKYWEPRVLSENEVVAGVEYLRKRMAKSKEPGFGTQLKTLADVEKLLLAQGWKSKQAKDNVFLLQTDGSWEYFTEFVLRRYVVELPWMSNEYEMLKLKDHINYGKRAVKALAALTGDELTFSRIGAAQRTEVKQKFLVLKFETEDWSYEFEYESESPLTPMILDDFATVLKKEKCRWSLHYDPVEGLLYYLPKNMKNVWVNADWEYSRRG